MKRRINVNKKEIDGVSFFYVDFGSETHGRKSFRLWISSKIVKEDEKGYFFETPINNVAIIKTEKGNLVLKPGADNLFQIVVNCGYRGGATYELLSNEITGEYKYYIYHSPLGNLGSDTCALITTPHNYIKYKWSKTGRLYGNPSKGITKINIDGSIEELDNIEDINDILKEAQ